METMEKNTIEKALDKSMSYAEYRDLVNELFANGKATGDNHSESYLNYTDLNIHRMSKWDKHFKVNNEVAALVNQLDNKETWLVISEGWCGDAAHALPVMNKLAELSENVELKVVLRDENLELMDKFLTNGGRSIPKLIRLNKDNEVLGTWGPRPQAAQSLLEDFKAAEKSPTEAKEALQLWYARNRGQAIEEELAALLTGI